MSRRLAPWRLAAPLAAAAVALVSQGCSEGAPAQAPSPRPVKVAVVGAQAADPPAAFVASVRARRRAELAFEAPGRVASVLVEVGDRVRSGQVLASLDTAPAQWRLERAQADRDAAAAQLRERALQLQLQEPLAREQMVSAAALESVRAQHAVAAAQLQAAEAALAAARRDAALARIAAPFDGEIVARTVQPHGEVAAGQAVLQIEAAGELEVVAMLPDGVAARLAPGQAAMARYAAPGGAPAAAPLRLERLSARSENGSLVQAIFRFADAAPAVRSGSVMQLELPRDAAPAIAVAPAALLLADQPGTGSVFLLDEARGRVVRRAVRVARQVLADGRIPVLSGLQPGELLVVAGAAFLADGQPAVRSAPGTLLTEAAR
jgi:RND family efflux transporter MFP subunit